MEVDRSSNCLLTCADDFLRLLFCHSSLFLYGNQLQQLPAAVFSGLTSLRSHVVFVCNEHVCILGDTGTKHTHTGHMYMVVSVGDLAD
jgi:hypothetical protein